MSKDVCIKCGSHYDLRAGAESTKLCDECAQKLVVKFNAENERLFVALNGIARGCYSAQDAMRIAREAIAARKGNDGK